MKEPVAKSSTLIRCPVADVFNAFVDPEMIKKFWLAETTGPLAPGARVTWTFMVPGAKDDVTVVAFEKDRHIAFDWSDGISVNLYFEESNDNLTTLRVTAEGFRGENALSDAINAGYGPVPPSSTVRLAVSVTTAGAFTRADSHPVKTIMQRTASGSVRSAGFAGREQGRDSP